MNVSKRIVSLVLTFFVFIGIAGIRANATSNRQSKIGVAFVNATSLRLRSGASTDTKTLDYAYNGEVVVLLDKVGQWYKVNFNLQTGYMHSKYLQTATKENAELGYGKINGSGVNVRSGPATSYGAITKAYLNDKAYIIGINNGWFKVIIGNHIGYIRSDYVDLYASRPSGSSSLSGRPGERGSSVENSTFRCLMPRLAHSFRIIRARGQTEVFVMSAIWNFVGSSLFPVPLELIMGTFAAFAACTRASFPVTVSMASTT